MKLYDVIEDNTYQDGSKDCWSIGIFDTEEKANELCEKMLRSIMYDSRQNKRFYVRVKQLNESKMTGEVSMPQAAMLYARLCLSRPA